MMTDPELAAQVERERVELKAAPVVPSAGTIARCWWCGRVIVGEPTLVETVGGRERYKGRCCHAE
jgi:hypothetical protein